MTSDANTAPEQECDLGTKAATAGGIVRAFVMTSCHILALVLFSLGATSVWIGQHGAPYQGQWLFFVFAAASLAYGFWKAYRHARQTCSDGSCECRVNQPSCCR
ncbi:MULTISPECIES: mercury transporter [unclassified Roseovarius]|uniref:mercury transporter n=1 Tax=unclassified Roseovarius TaxID=2614913 RepID=UPI00273F292E|nr:MULTISPECIES: mercury transporter [unclassified Roseovarius]